MQARGVHSPWALASPVVLVVMPAFYQTRWFELLCVLLCMYALYFAYQLRLAQVARHIQVQVEARANERIRIARDLHDTLLQGFQGLMLNIHVAAQEVPTETQPRRLLENALKRADNLLSEGRDRIGDLRGGILRDKSLEEAFRKVGEELATGTGIDFRVDSSLPVRKLNEDVAEEAFYIGREAIVNSFRHARTRRISVVLKYDRRQLELVLADDGIGISERPELSEVRDHFGMVGMQERARKLNAVLSQESADPGTIITLRIPATVAYSQTSRPR